MSDSAVVHSRELRRHGYTVDEVVHDYGDFCQAVIDLAIERRVGIRNDEFGTLSRCLADVTAIAVSEYSRQRDSASAERHTMDVAERLGVLAHELRNHLSSATLAFELIHSGKADVEEAAGGVVKRSLVGLRTLIDRTLADVRIASGMPGTHPVFAVAEFISEAVVSARLEADLRGCILVTADTPPGLAVSGDRDLLLAALDNLLQNACKFTRPGTQVSLEVRGDADLVIIEVRDHCGGLPKPVIDAIFEPFVQVGSDRSGVGLGLSIARRSIEAHGGTLGARSIADTGCVFSMSLPRYTVPAPAAGFEHAQPG